MSLPEFFSRVSDSITPLLSGAAGSGRASVRDFLEEKSVALWAPDDIDRHPFHLAGFLLLTNLCARLYPRIAVNAPIVVVEQCRSLVHQINPACDFLADQIDPETASANLFWSRVVTIASGVNVAPVGWDVVVDEPESAQVCGTNMLCALAAGAIGAAELFRQVFAEFLPNGRTKLAAGRFNLLTHPGAVVPPAELPPDIPLGRVHLVGAGAIGEAMVYALARVSVTGTIVVVDPEPIAASNLQRYVLASASDVGASKCALVERELVHSKLETVVIEHEWDLGSSDTARPEVICAAVDTEALRIALQAALPMRLYNAWTQPGDIGWSRHEEFGVGPCCACLYWPTGPRPHFHQLVARAVRQHELRVLAYLASNVPVDSPLAAALVPKLPQYPLPQNAAAWSDIPLLDDIANELRIPLSELATWRGRLLADLYREGICGGALMHGQQSAVPTEMAVPLAQQSVLAGIMLATQLLVASSPQLAPFRSAAIESRLDLLAGLPQITARPRQPTKGCMCADRDFVTRYRAKWPYRGQ